MRYNGYIDMDDNPQMEEVLYVGDAGLSSEGIMSFSEIDDDIPPDTYLDFNHRRFQTQEDFINAIMQITNAKTYGIIEIGNEKFGDSFVFGFARGYLKLFVPPRHEPLDPHRDNLVYRIDTTYGYAMNISLLKTLTSLQELTQVLK